MSNFEIYKRQNSRGRYNMAATVTVQRRGVIAFSATAAEKLGNPTAIKFLVDRDERLLGFAPCQKKDANAYSVRHYGTRSKTYLVSASQVCESLGVDLTESRRYPLTEADGVLCIDLKEPGLVVTSNARVTTSS